MRIKALFVFLAVQITIFVTWQSLHASNPGKKELPTLPVMVSTSAPSSPSAPLSHPSGAAKNDFSGIRFSAKSSSEEYGPVDPIRKREIVEILNKLPQGQADSLNNLVLDYNPDAHRGLGGKNLIILRAVDISLEEFTAVFIHELGHNTDLGYLNETDQKEASEFKDFRSPIYEGDPSLDYYRISWLNETARKKTAVNEDFVSGYAMTDPFEDFAETYAFYVLHNRDFQLKAQSNDAIMKKYEFMKNIAFGGKVYNTGSDVPAKPNQRPWDVTLLPYDLNEFLNS